MSPDSILDVARDFNARDRQEFLRVPRIITAPNDWHISIRRIPIQPPRHVVYFLHPLSRCFGHSESIETAMGYQLGEYVFLGGFLLSATHELQSFNLIERWLTPALSQYSRLRERKRCSGDYSAHNAPVHLAWVPAGRKALVLVYQQQGSGRKCY